MSAPRIYRPRLAAFVADMEAKLSLPNNRRKGDWRRESTSWLMWRLLSEVAELQGALASVDMVGLSGIIKECADVANFAMMIADKARASQSKGGSDVRATQPGAHGEERDA